MFSTHLAEGATHVLGGLDHLLFLLVVLASGWTVRNALLAQSCFAVGHGITLAATAFGIVSAPAAIVEPAIAASIVGMAVFDRWAASRQRSGVWPWAPWAVWAPWARLALVFVFALIHGLGLAGALGDLGLDTGHKLWSLAGFNVGVELARVGVAALAGASVWAVARLRGPGAWALALRMVSGGAVIASTFWFVERVVALA